MFTLKFRRDYSWRWAQKNPILEEGEPGLETNTGRFKVGDGYKHWLELDYFTPLEPEIGQYASITAHVNDTTPHPVYDDGPSLNLLYENAKV